MPTALNKLMNRCLLATLLSIGAITAKAGVLPEDRADVLYHVYNGDGITVQGPALLVRKKFGESVDATATYDADSVTGASIDTRTLGASPLKEHRKEWSGGVSYLRGKTTYNVNYMNSKETDYISDNASFSISEDMFGDLTTVTLGFTRGWDDISENESSEIVHKGNADRRVYRLGLSQILTKNFIIALNYDSTALDGYLQNPYRKYRFGAPNQTPTNRDEIYPRTRTSNALSIDGRYYLPYRASINANYRFYTDSWGIVAHTGELGYIQPVKTDWTFEASARYYTQTHADFYADLFPFENAQNFMARDKILSSFNDWSLRVGGTWRLNHKLFFVKSSVLSLFIDHIQYNYQDFKNGMVGATPSVQPLFAYSANVYAFQWTANY